jgi:hypothetical protein
MARLSRTVLAVCVSLGVLLVGGALLTAGVMVSGATGCEPYIDHLEIT